MIAAFNAQELLPSSIASAKSQIGVTVEIVVSDDASTDGTADLMKDYPDVIYRRLERNSGPSAARNAAIEVAKGDWIAVLDADDVMRPDCLINMVKLASETQADVVLGNFERVDHSGRPLDDAPFLEPASLDREMLSVDTYVAHNLLVAGEKDWGYLKPLFRREFLGQTGIRYDLSLRNSEDYHIVLAALEADARVVVSPEPNYLYRVAAGSISHVVAPDIYAALKTADDLAAARLKPRASSALLKALETRRQNLSAMMYSEEVMFALKTRQPARAALALLRHPKTFGRVAYKLREAARKRFARPASRQDGKSRNFS